jgi:hypothetical protein
LKKRTNNCIILSKGITGKLRLRLEENIEMDIGELRLYGCEIN